MKRKVKDKKTGLMFAITDYNPGGYDKQQLKKWCIEQALQCTAKDDDGNVLQVEPVAMAQKIYNWVSK